MTDLRRTPLRRLLLLSALMGGASLVEDTATGNPLTFETDVAKPLRSLLIPFTPVQSGTGDPSPQNVRPIVPWDGLSVYHSGADTSEYTETDISFPSPVYGGTLDVVSGELWATWVKVNSANVDWEYNETYGVWYTSPTPTKKESNAGILSDQYAPTTAGFRNMPEYTIRGNASNSNIFIKNSSFTSEEDVKQAGFDISYELASPVLITTLTPQQITALVGNNTIWSDADGQLTAVYLKKA